MGPRRDASPLQVSPMPLFLSLLNRERYYQDNWLKEKFKELDEASNWTTLQWLSCYPNIKIQQEISDQYLCMWRVIATSRLFSHIYHSLTFFLCLLLWQTHDSGFFVHLNYSLFWNPTGTKNEKEDKESGRYWKLEITVLGVKKLYYNSKRTSSDLYTRPVFPGV